LWNIVSCKLNDAVRQPFKEIIVLHFRPEYNRNDVIPSCNL